MHQMENESSSPNKCSENSSCSSKNIIQLKPSYGRYCHIVKRPDFDGYGFNLHSEKVKPGQYIGKVDANSPAEAAGLREGDQIIEVNGVNIGTETHKQVVQRIKAISNEVRLLLVDTANDVVSQNTKNQSNIPEKNTINSKISTSATTNPKSPSELSVVETSLPTIVPVTEAEEAGAAAAPLEQKEYITSFSMVTTKSQSTNPTMNPTDFVDRTTNGHHANGQARSTVAMTTVTTGSPLSAVDHVDSSLQQHTNNETNNKTGLNLNLTAAAMRAKLLAKKKFDPKNESVDLKKKFDIIQKL